MGDSTIGRPGLAQSSCDITCATFQTLVFSSLNRGTVLVNRLPRAVRCFDQKSPGVKPQAASMINSAQNITTLRVVVTRYIIADLVGGGH